MGSYSTLRGPPRIIVLYLHGARRHMTQSWVYPETRGSLCGRGPFLIKEAKVHEKYFSSSCFAIFVLTWTWHVEMKKWTEGSSDLWRHRSAATTVLDYLGAIYITCTKSKVLHVPTLWVGFLFPAKWSLHWYSTKTLSSNEISCKTPYI